MGLNIPELPLANMQDNVINNDNYFAIYSITTINDSGNETLLVGTTSGQIIEVTLP